MNRDYPKATYEQLKESHFKWREEARRNFNAYEYEKERADKAEEELEKSRAERKQFNQVYELLLKKFHTAESNEQKLKGAINEALKWTWYHGEANMVAIDDVLQETMASLYPKE